MLKEKEPFVWTETLEVPSAITSVPFGARPDTVPAMLDWLELEFQSQALSAASRIAKTRNADRRTAEIAEVMDGSPGLRIAQRCPTQSAVIRQPAVSRGRYSATFEPQPSDRVTKRSRYRE